MNYLDMSHAVQEAQAIIERADMYTQRMAKMIKGKLRSGQVHAAVLIAFKKELQGFDMRTWKWKE